MIERLRQVFTHALDFDAQVRFYEALGFTLQFRDGGRWAQFAAGDVSFALASGDEALGAAPGEWMPVFEVASLEGAMDAALAAGGSAGEVRDMGGHGRTVRIADATGTSFVLFARA